MGKKTANLLRIGFFADGVFKAAVAVAMLVLFALTTDNLGAPGRLLLVTAFAVSASAVAEISFAVRNGSGTHTKYLVVYDAGWILVSVVVLVLPLQCSGYGSVLWLSYQLILSPVVAVLFLHGSLNRRRDAGSNNSSPG